MKLAPIDFRHIAACAAALMALSATGAEAAPALATNNVNMRQGPGTNYPIITTIPGGSTVEVAGCQGQWCTVVWQGQTGYSTATSFDQGAGAPRPGAAGPPPGAEAPPPVPPGAIPPQPPPVGGYPPPPGATAEGPIRASPPGAPPPGYPPPPPGYYTPPGYYYPPPPYDPYYGPYGYGPYWRRGWW